MSDPKNHCVVGRRVKTLGGEEGEVIKWEPLCSGMTDTLVRFDKAGEVWVASHTLRFSLDGASLPARREVVQKADREALRKLRAIRAQHVRDFEQPWPGAEFGKAIVGRAIDGAIAEIEKRIGNTKESKPLMVPTIHSNGTSRDVLVKQVCTAAGAVYEAMRALISAAPNNRDYYPQCDGAFGRAYNEHFDRAQRLHSVVRELTELYEAICNAGLPKGGQPVLGVVIEPTPETKGWPLTTDEKFAIAVQALWDVASTSGKAIEDVRSGDEKSGRAERALEALGFLS